MKHLHGNHTLEMETQQMVLACIMDKWSKARYVYETYLGVRCLLKAKEGTGRMGKLSCAGRLRSPVNCEWANSWDMAGCN